MKTNCFYRRLPRLILHDIGQFISYASHHKHSVVYLIRASQHIGLNTAFQVNLIANIAPRHHRKAIPKATHDGYRLLMPRERLICCPN